MKSSMLLLLISAPLFGLSQDNLDSTVKIYESEKGLELIDPIKWEHVKDGFSIGDGHVAYIFRLDSNHTFKFVEFDCVAEITLDRGTWKIKDNKSLLLKSKKRKYTFDVIKFGNFTFYISPNQRLEFVKDLQTERNLTASYKAEETGPRYSRESFMGFHLQRKYYGYELIQ